MRGARCTGHGPGGGGRWHETAASHMFVDSRMPRPRLQTATELVTLLATKTLGCGSSGAPVLQAAPLGSIGVSRQWAGVGDGEGQQIVDVGLLGLWGTMDQVIPILVYRCRCCCCCQSQLSLGSGFCSGLSVLGAPFLAL